MDKHAAAEDRVVHLPLSCHHDTLNLQGWSSHVRRWTLHKHSGHVLMGKGLFTIDSRMSIDQRTAPIVAEFAANKYRFFQIFSSAFVKLSLSNVLTNDEGEVGRKCNQVN
ncbi:hypothetical protein V6N13_120093 [Hibiscus sabdariffa]